MHKINILITSLKYAKEKLDHFQSLSLFVIIRYDQFDIFVAFSVLYYLYSISNKLFSSPLKFPLLKPVVLFSLGEAPSQAPEVAQGDGGQVRVPHVRQRT